MDWINTGYLSSFEIAPGATPDEIIRAINAGADQSFGNIIHIMAVPPGNYREIDLTGGARLAGEDGVERVDGSVWEHPGQNREFTIYRTARVTKGFISKGRLS